MPEAVDWGGGVSNAWTSVATFIPKLIAFLVILLIGFFIAKAIQKILTKVLQKVGFDRLVERGGIKQALARSQYDAAGLIATLVYYAIMLIVLSTAFGVFGPNPISEYLHAIVAYLPLIFVAIIIVIITAAIAAAVKSLVENSLGGLSYARTLGIIAAGFIWALGIIAALDQLHIAATIVDAVLYAALAAIVGVTVVAVGGGGIAPMSQRWRNVLDRYDQEKPNIQQAARNNPSPRQQAQQAQQQLAPTGAGQQTPQWQSGATSTDQMPTQQYPTGQQYPPQDYPPAQQY